MNEIIPLSTPGVPSIGKHFIPGVNSLSLMFDGILVSRRLIRVEAREPGSSALRLSSRTICHHILRRISASNTGSPSQPPSR